MLTKITRTNTRENDAEGLLFHCISEYGSFVT